MESSRTKSMEVKFFDGVEVQVTTWREIREHEIGIIEDNVLYGLMHGYSEEEIEDYEREAYQQLRDLKRAIDADPNITLIIDSTTDRFVTG